MIHGKSNSFIATAAGIGLMAATLFMGNVFGQVNTANNKDQSLRSSGRVNPSTLGMEIDIPLGGYPGRGINMPVGISYSTKLWRLKYALSVSRVNNPESCISLNAPKFAENSASGWTTSLAVPYVEYVGVDNLYDDTGASMAANHSICESSTSLPEYHNNAFLKRIVIHLPSGETHEMRADDYIISYPQSEQNPPINFNATFYAVDGSNLKYIENSSTGTYVLTMPDGSKYNFSSSGTLLNGASTRKASTFTDRNGNYTTYHEPNSTYTNGYWTDTLGRTVPIPLSLQAPASAGTQDYVMQGLNGGSMIYKLYWKQLKGSTSSASGLSDFSQSLKYAADHAGMNTAPRDASQTLFQSGGDDWIIDGGVGAVLFNPIVLTAVEMPNGQKYEFSYNIFGEIERILYPTGGEEKFVQGMVDSLSDVEAPHTQMNRGVTNRKVYISSGTGTPYEWNYVSGFVPPNGFLVTVINPDGTKKERSMNRSSCFGCGPFGYENALSGKAYEEKDFDSGGRIVGRKLTNWTTSSLSVTIQVPGTNGPYSIGSIAQWHPRVSSEESIIYDLSGSGISTTTTFEYEGDLNLRDSPVLMKKSSQYAFVPAGSPLPSNPIRSSESTFLINDPSIPQPTKDIYKNQNMVGIVTASQVKDGAGTIVSRSEMVYDESGRSPGYRGNPTTAKVWDSTKGTYTSSVAYISTSARFDNYGNQYEATDAKGQVVLHRILNAGEVASASGALPLKVVVGRANNTQVQIRGNAFDLNPVAKDNVARFEVK